MTPIKIRIEIVYSDIIIVFFNGWNHYLLNIQASYHGRK